MIMHSDLGGKMFILPRILIRIVEMSALLVFTYFIIYSTIKK